MRIYLLIITFSLYFMLSQSHADPVQNRTIKVSGMGVVNSVPNLFSFSVHLEERGKLANKLNLAITEKTSQAVSLLMELGIEKKDIQSLQVRFNPWIEYNRDGNIQKGFILTRKITVTLTNLALYDKAIDSLLNLGINRIDGFNSSNSENAKHYEQALSQSLLDAKTKAIKMADTLGLNLGTVVTISEDSSGRPAPVQMDMMRASKAESYQPGEMATQARVEVVFELIPKT